MSDQGDEILEAMREALVWSQGEGKSRVTRFCPLCGGRIEGDMTRDELDLAVCPDCGWQATEEDDD